MNRPRFPLLLSFILVISLGGLAQSAPAAQATGASSSSSTAQAAKSDYSQEASVIEQMTTRIEFQNDGNSAREQVTRVRVQTDAGVKEWGLLSMPFQSATQTVEIEYVRVRKPDGTTVVTPEDNVQDLDAEITRAAPFYSDLREKHVAVKGLANGDILEYAVRWHGTRPLIPGQFWFDYNFNHDGIVLEERLELRVPAERAVKVKGPRDNATVKTEGGVKVYAWTHSELKRTKDAADTEKKETDTALGRLPMADVQLSSFQSWEEVGRWYWSLQKERVEPTAAIRAKAAELTKGLSYDNARIRALYYFVSTHYRYIGIAFGIGRYQPHAADDVLGNNYGDCKDKHTLLASLLEAAGITIYPALINSSHTLDEDVPSPAQFDHLIGYLPQGKEALWLDTTEEVAPEGLLVQKLRDKQALVMAGEKSIRLVRTPSEPPTPGQEKFEVDGKLDEKGNFEAKINYTARGGDNEVIMRTLFRQVPEPRWKELVQQISYRLNFAGTVDEVKGSAPEAMDEAFHFSYSYNRKDYPDWSNRQFTVPGLPFYMPPLRDDARYPVWLGAAGEMESDVRVQLPKEYQAEAPSDVDLKYDFAEYHATYAEEKGALVAKRVLQIKMHEVPVAEFADYRNFLKSLNNDVWRYVQTRSSNSPGISEDNYSMPAASFVNTLRNLPESDSSEANQLEALGREEMQKGDLRGAGDSFKRAVEVDPKFTRGWVLLGTMRLAQKQIEDGTEAFHKAIALNPGEPAISKALAFSLMADMEFEEAAAAWNEHIKAHPNDVDGPSNLGNCLVQLKRYTEAAAAYEAALKIKKDKPGMVALLGIAYLKGGDRQKATEAFGRLAALEPDPMALNNSAYEMANADLQLPTALDYGKKAVRAVEETTQEMTLEDLKTKDLQNISKLSMYWDTLGWVEERMSNLDGAEKYLRAAWRLSQDGVVAGHLCHLYKRTHETAKAVEMCRMGIFRMSMSKNVSLEEYATELVVAKENLANLTRGAPKTNNLGEGSDLVIRERTFKLPRFLPGTESAEFWVLLASDGKSKEFKVEDVKYISGSEKMKAQGKQLKTIDFKVPEPDDTPTKFVRRGILGCYEYTGCSFVLLDPATVQSVN
jgi:Tfp pilus assembly protein PilF